MLVVTLGKYHAGYGGIPAHDYEEKNGYAGGAYHSEAAADTCRVESGMAYAVHARFRKIGFRVSGAKRY